MIIASSDWFTPTRGIGIATYGTATLSCIAAWAIVGSRGIGSKLSARLASIEGLLLLDIFFNWRWNLHQAIVELAARRGIYEMRRGPQTLVIGILAGLFVTALMVVLRRLRGRSAALLAMVGVVLSITLWCAEVVSLHAVDHILYMPVGGVMAITYVWILASSMTSIGILLDSR